MVGIGICIGTCVGPDIDIGVESGSIQDHVVASRGMLGTPKEHVAASELASADSIWDYLQHQESSGIIWQHLEASGNTWQHLGWYHLAASGSIWVHVNRTCCHSLCLRMVPTPENAPENIRPIPGTNARQSALPSIFL